MHTTEELCVINFESINERSCVASLIPFFSNLKPTTFLHSLFRENRAQIGLKNTRAMLTLEISPVFCDRSYLELRVARISIYYVFILLFSPNRYN